MCSVMSAFPRQHPFPSGLSLEPKCALDKFNICGNGCVEVQRLASWMGCQKLGHIKKSSFFYILEGKTKTKPKNLSVETPYVVLQNIIPLQEPLFFCSLYPRVSTTPPPQLSLFLFILNR